MRTFLVGICLLVAVALTLAPAEAEDAGAIRRVIGAQWDKAGEPVKIDPIVVQNDDAIADWTQGERGGRALLKRTDGRWRVVVCSGDALKAAGALEQTGISPAAAKSLEDKLATAEASIDPQRRAQFSRFEGVLQMDRE